jgi:hypothetical protein
VRILIFSKPASAYANTSSGSINNIGVIGTAIYGLYDPAKLTKATASVSADNGYAKPTVILINR